VNQLLSKHLLLLHILLLVVELSNLHQTTIHAILTCHIILVGPRCRCLRPTSLPSPTPSFKLVGICPNILLQFYLLVADRKTNGSTRQKCYLETVPAS
jgi:hypothetical protein